MLGPCCLDRQRRPEAQVGRKATNESTVAPSSSGGKRRNRGASGSDSSSFSPASLGPEGRSTTSSKPASRTSCRYSGERRRVWGGGGGLATRPARAGERREGEGGNGRA